MARNATLCRQILSIAGSGTWELLFQHAREIISAQIILRQEQTRHPHPQALRIYYPRFFLSRTLSACGVPRGSRVNLVS